MADDRAPRRCVQHHRGRILLLGHRLFAAERLLGEISFTLRISPVTLPDARDYRFYLSLWQHSANIARKYDCGWAQTGQAFGASSPFSMCPQFVQYQ